MFSENNNEEFIPWPIALKKFVDSNYYQTFKTLNEKHYRKAHDHLHKKRMLNHSYDKSEDRFEQICAKCGHSDNHLITAYVLGAQTV